MIRAVLFDFGGVLSKGGQSVSRDIAEILGIPKQDLNFQDVHEKFRRGHITSSEFFGTIDSRHGGDGTLENKLLNRPNFFEKQEDIYKLAEDLKQAGIKTAILSNVYQPSADLLRQKGFYQGFDPVLLSCETGYAKPDKEFYQLAVDKLALKPEECVLIDDQDKCLIPAEEFGMKTVKFVNPEQVINDTNKLVFEDR